MLQAFNRCHPDENFVVTNEQARFARGRALRSLSVVQFDVREWLVH